jgi:hypothetical protein
VIGVIAVLVATLAIMHTALEGAFAAVLVASYSAAVHGSTLLTRILLVAAIAAVFGIGIADGFGANTWLGAHYRSGRSWRRPARGSSVSWCASSSSRRERGTSRCWPTAPTC